MKSKKNTGKAPLFTQNKPILQSNSPKSLKKSNKAPPKPLQSLPELYTIWDAKLKESGFKDLERRTPDCLDAENMILGHSLVGLARTYKPETELYYKRLTHYLTHVNNPMRDVLLNQIVGWLAEAVPYREIVKRVRHNGGRMNIQKVHKINQEFLRRALHWNKSNPNGVDFSPDFESMPLRKFKLKST